MVEFEPVLTRNIDVLDKTQIDVYEGDGGYRMLRKGLLEMTAAEVSDAVLRSNLRGRGGAGFPTGRKWSFLPNDGRPRYLCCNADEGEPGTFKDRMLIEKNPHLLIEGLILAAYAIGAARTFVYVRGEFAKGARTLERAIEEARARGYVGDRILGTGFSQEIVVHRGAGAYICGEETALLESLEGKRGEPRLKPPFPATHGLYGMPTVVNNVETLSLVPCILERGPEWFAGLGSPSSPGIKIASISGRVQRPGNYEVILGTTLRELIFDVAGGLLPGRRFKAVLPGGASSGALVEEHLDLPWDFDSIAKAGSMLGSGGIVVLDDSDCIVRSAWILVRFFAHESCGQCTPCREGAPWIARVLERIEGGGGRPEDIELIANLGDQIRGRTLCPLGDAAVGFVASTIKHFREDYLAHMTGRACPLEVKIA